jgi:hypothetical protein
MRASGSNVAFSHITSFAATHHFWALLEDNRRCRREMAVTQMTPMDMSALSSEMR